jgi:hypothetical protein
MNGDTGLTWRAIAGELNEMAKATIAAILHMARHSWVLLVIVVLTGWLSYESLVSLAVATGWSGVAALVFPFQLDVAAIPAYQVVFNRDRPRGHRVFAGVMGLAVIGGSVYGNLAAHFFWTGAAPIVFVSVISPSICAATLVLWHLPKVVDATQGAHRWLQGSDPTETSSEAADSTRSEQADQGASELGASSAPANEEAPSVGASVHDAEVQMPEGDWTTANSAASIRSFARAFETYNGRLPRAQEVYAAMPATRKDRNAPSVLRGMTPRERTTEETG